MDESKNPPSRAEQIGIRRSTDAGSPSRVDQIAVKPLPKSPGRAEMLLAGMGLDPLDELKYVASPSSRAEQIGVTRSTDAKAASRAEQITVKPPSKAPSRAEILAGIGSDLEEKSSGKSSGVSSSNSGRMHRVDDEPVRHSHSRRFTNKP